MKKILLSMGALALATSLNAEKVAFVAADAEEFYDGDAKTVVIMPEGFYFDTCNDNAPTTKIKKGLASDVVYVESTTEVTGSTTAAKANKCYVTSGGLRWYTNQALKFTPAPGITLKNIKIRSQRYTDKAADAGKLPGDYVYPITVNAADTKFDVTDPEKIMISAELNTNEAIGLKPTGQIRVFYIELEYEGTTTQTAMPVCSATLPAVAADQEITLTSATEGAEIYYTLDGTVPTASSTKYSAPFKLDKDAVVRAIAVKGESTSFPYYGEFFVVEAGTSVATFNLSDWNTLVKADNTKFADTDFVKSKEEDTPPCNMFIAMNGVEIVDGDASLKFEGENAQIFKSWTFGNVVEYRPNTGSKVTAAAKEGHVITNVVVVGSSILKAPALSIGGEVGKGAISPVNSARYAWAAPAEGVASTTIDGGEYIDQVYVYYKKTAQGSAVAEVEVAEDAPVEYYNLQGVRVANPENGLFIVKQGNKVSKKIFK